MRLIDADELMKSICGHECGVYPEDCDGMESKTVPCNFYAYVSEMKTVEHQSAWIPCSERLPEVDQDVILFVHHYIDIGSLRPYAMWCIDLFDYDIGSVTHWMPLPEPPKEENNERKESL